MSQTENTPAACARCGAVMAAGSPGGLCVRCALAQAFATSPDEAEARSLSLHDIPPPGEQVARIGAYELREVLGRGGMGVVYKAWQQQLERWVALKVLLGGMHASDEFKRRFEQEARALAQLQHPNIVRIYEVGEHQGQPFFAMDLVAGSNLAGLTQGQPLPPRQAAAYLTTVAETLQYVHDHGLLHRDLKPSNILVDQHNQPRLTDFGLAKQEESDHDLTGSNQGLGTPGYLPPEQVSAECGPTSRHSDVYGLGAVLYYLLTGRPPFAAASLGEVLRQVLDAEPVPPRTLNPAVPRDLETICLKCLQKDQRRRYASAHELAEDLQRWLAGKPIVARPVSFLEKAAKWIGRNRLVSVLVAIVVVAVGAGLATTRWQLARTERTVLLLRKVSGDYHLSQAEEALSSQRSSESLAILCPQVREDPSFRPAVNRLLALLTQRNWAWPESEPLPPDSQIDLISYSADLRYLATDWSSNAVRLWDAVTGQPVGPLVAHTSRPTSVAFNSLGTRLAAAFTNGTVKLCEVPSGQLVSALILTSRVSSVSFSADGHRLLIAAADRVARLLDAETGRNLATRPVPGTNEIGMAVLSPDGRLALAAAGRNAYLWDADTSQPIGASLEYSNPIVLVDFSPNGDRFFTVEQKGFLRQYEARTGRALGKDIRSEADIRAAEFSPEGRRIAALCGARTACLWDADSGQEVIPPLRHPGVLEFLQSIHFSPEGERLVTTSDDGLVRVWNTRTNELWLEPMPMGFLASTSEFSRDGTRLAATAANGRTLVWDVLPGQALPLLFGRRDGVRRGELDASGRRVLTAGTNGQARVWDAKTAQPLTPPMLHSSNILVAHFSPNGRAVGTGSSDQTARLWDATSGQPLTAPLPHPAAVIEACFDRSGRWLFTLSEDAGLRIWDTVSGRLLAQTQASLGDKRPPAYKAEFSAEGKTVFLACRDNTLRAWDWQSGQPDRVMLRHKADLSHCCVSSDGSRLASMSFDFTVKLLDLRAGGRVVATLPHDNQVFCGAFSSDGRVLATAGQSGVVSLWDGRSGAPLATRIKHPGFVRCVAFSPEGDRLATASLDGTVWVSDVELGLPLCDPLRHSGPVGWVQFSADGQRLLTVCRDQEARIWDLPAPSTPAPAWLADLAEALVGQRVSRQGQLERVPISEVVALRRALAANTSTDLFSTWGRWFAAPRSTRTISPFSDVTVPQYVESCLAGGNTNRLREALLLDPTNQAIRRRLEAR